jgi:hypothetical protein
VEYSGCLRDSPKYGCQSSCNQCGAANFLIAALKDPFSGNLDRMQVIKGWLNPDCTRGEKVYDVAWGRSSPKKHLCR